MSGLAAIENSKVTKDFRRREVIFREGDPCDGVYCVQAGEIALTKSDRDGNVIILRITESDAMLGLHSVLGGTAHAVTAVVLTPSRVCYVPRTAVEVLIERNPKMAREFFKHVSMELDDMDNRFLSATGTTVRQRLIRLLDSIKDRYGVSRANSGVVLQMPLSRNDLAAMVATRPETISRTIHQLRSEGIADFREKIVTIPDIGRLAVEARRAGAT